MTKAARPPAPVDGDFLTIEEVAKIFRLSERTVRRRLQDGTFVNALGPNSRTIRLRWPVLPQLSSEEPR